MTKKLLPAMIGVALVSGAAVAQADVTVFGHIDTSVANVDEDWDGGTDDTNFVCTTCSIGFKGSEDLGNGLKAIFSLDFQYDTVNRNTGKASGNKPSGATAADPVTSVSDTSSITDRDQWLGLAGNFGKIRIGTISTGYKSHGAAIDPLYRTVAQGRDHLLQSRLHSGAGEEGQGRATNTLRWDSPNWNGLQAVAHYTLDSDEGNGEDDDPYGIGASYTNGGIMVFADYITNDGDNDVQGELEAFKLGGKYSMNNFAVYAQYEDIEDSNVDGELWHIAGSYTMGNNMVYIAYGEGEGDDGSTNTVDDETESFTIAGTHSMSKRTTIYAAYNAKTETDNLRVSDKDDDTDTFAIGMKHKF